ncbi:hypothetical protein [Terracoccus luteus]|uniref:Uncharacterized protein n=1 Tax=Terracoccus luteus TaxID=53356 RepID=A0A839PYA2_9MICO|nr:hypothetical protein [Terracoccus luteus]MBB2988507.1 hypothetical protein [Terracoccus luteus]MCP2174146.1 hypothetical protein [Terracoccus luteus]
MDGINAKYKATSNDALAGLGGLMENLGEFTRMLHKLDELAPDEIKSEMSESVKAWDRQADTAQEMVKNPLGALAGGLASSIMSSGSMKAVDVWAKQNCQMPVFGFADAGESLAKGLGAGTAGSGSAETTATPETSPTTEEVALGPGMVKSPGRGTSTVTFLRRGGVIALDADGGLGELGSGDGRKVGVVDEKTYEVLAVQPLNEQCGWSLVATAAGDPVLLRGRVVKTEAAGVNAESYEAFVDGTNARTNAELWSSKVPGRDPSDPSCPNLDVDATPVTQTTDLRFASVGGWPLDPATGKFQGEKAGLVALGNWWLEGTTGLLGQGQAILSPDTGKVLGRVDGEVLRAQWPTDPLTSYAPVWQDGGEGRTLITRTTEVGDTVVSAIALPSGNIRWTVKPTGGTDLHGVDAQTGTLLLGNDAFSRDGKLLWSGGETLTEWCGASGGKVFVIAATAATLDVRTGKQLDYSDGQHCSGGVSDGTVRVDSQQQTIQFRLETPGAQLPDVPTD